MEPCLKADASRVAAVAGKTRLVAGMPFAETGPLLHPCDRPMQLSPGIPPLLRSNVSVFE
jgi:hypothetical protein